MMLNLMVVAMQLVAAGLMVVAAIKTRQLTAHLRAIRLGIDNLRTRVDALEEREAVRHGGIRLRVIDGAAVPVASDDGARNL